MILTLHVMKATGWCIAELPTHNSLLLLLLLHDSGAYLDLSCLYPSPKLTVHHHNANSQPSTACRHCLANKTLVDS